MPSPYDLEHVINAIADPIFVKDRQHCWVLLNDACCRFMGTNRERVIGKSDYDFFPKREADVSWAKDELVFESGQENVNIEQFTDSSGATYTITTKKVLYVNSAGAPFIVGCITDVTAFHSRQRELERARDVLEVEVRDRTLELATINKALSHQIENHEKTSQQLRQSQKMEALGHLAGGIAHDFNNLLNVIIGYGALVEQWPGSDGKLKETGGQIVGAGETAALLTRQLLAFSRKQVLQPELLKLDDVVCGIGGMLRRLIGVEIDLEIEAEANLGCVRADRGQFEQVVMNLAVNARDAMPAGGKLTIRTSNIRLSNDGAETNGTGTSDYVLMSVTDTGKGMDQEIQAHIFEPFFTTKEQGKGTGLGLATVYGIVAQSKGRIQVQSSPGEGSTFMIYLPRVIEEDCVRAQPQAAVASRKRSATILLVEDQQELRMLLREVLRSTGHTVITTASGAEAIEAVRAGQERIDLLITDIVMPGMRGWELARRLKSAHPKLKVLYISGHTDTDLINDGALRAGDILLEKPFRPDSLLNKVDEVLGQVEKEEMAAQAKRA